MAEQLEKVRFRNFVCIPKWAHYSNGRKALTLSDAEDGEPVATASVNIPSCWIDHDEIIVKNYSENEGMLKALIDAKIVSEPVRYTASGFINNIPICKIL